MVNIEIGLQDRNVSQTSDGSRRRSLLVDCVCKQMSWFQWIWLVAPRMMKGGYERLAKCWKKGRVSCAENEEKWICGSSTMHQKVRSWNIQSEFYNAQRVITQLNVAERI
ncbi:hypothetical protein NPIL_340111 [Nephila pilipes]|uniref:Uncharacterized protein n=1 Tax=Nephila pilipes TaxID=299642 RepID=A0A8X6R021_NEPPI|nr:hypothetical protein NPIL_340111 [Nephila pilipes]